MQRSYIYLHQGNEVMDGHNSQSKDKTGTLLKVYFLYTNNISLCRLAKGSFSKQRVVDIKRKWIVQACVTMN